MKRVVIPIVVVAVLTSAGCFRLGGPDNVTTTLSREAGVELDQEIGVTVTRGGIWLAKKGMRWIDEEEMPSLKGLKRVEVGVYTVRYREDDGGAIGPHLFPKEWNPWVRVQDGGSDVLVMVKQGAKPENIKGMLVVVTEDEEWVVVRMKGDLDQILEETLRFAFDQTDKPELYDKTREERDLPPLDDEGEEQEDVAV